MQTLTSNIAQIPPLKGLQIWSCHLHLGQMNQVTGGSTAQKTSEKFPPGSNKNQRIPAIFLQLPRAPLVHIQSAEVFVERKMTTEFSKLQANTEELPLAVFDMYWLSRLENPQPQVVVASPFLLWKPFVCGTHSQMYRNIYMYIHIYTLSIIYTCQCTYISYKAATTPQACITASGFKSSIPSIGSKFQNL